MDRRSSQLPVRLDKQPTIAEAHFSKGGHVRWAPPLNHYYDRMAVNRSQHLPQRQDHCSDAGGSEGFISVALTEAYRDLQSNKTSPE